MREIAYECDEPVLARLSELTIQRQIKLSFSSHFLSYFATKIVYHVLTFSIEKDSGCER